MSRAAQKARMDAYVVAEIQADPFEYALAKFKEADAQCRQAHLDFVAASQALRAEIQSIMEQGS